MHRAFVWVAELRRMGRDQLRGGPGKPVDRGEHPDVVARSRHSGRQRMSVSALCARNKNSTNERTVSGVGRKQGPSTTRRRVTTGSAGFKAPGCSNLQLPFIGVPTGTTAQPLSVMLRAAHSSAVAVDARRAWGDPCVGRGQAWVSSTRSASALERSCCSPPACERGPAVRWNQMSDSGLLGRR